MDRFLNEGHQYFAVRDKYIKSVIKLAPANILYRDTNTLDVAATYHIIYIYIYI